MPPVSIVFGIILIPVGVFCYSNAEPKSITALIPTFLGVLFVVLGLIGLRDSLRKHAMHAAAAVGLLGFLGSGYRLVKHAMKTSGDVDPYAAVTAGLCLVFVILCVRSFVMARRRRKQEAGVRGVGL